MEHYGVDADITTFAKSVAGGVPLSGLCGRAEIMDAAGRGGLGGTYAGNPLAIAAAHAVIDIIDQEKLCARAVMLGRMAMDRLDALRAAVPEIAVVRGLGSMVAVEFANPQTGRPDAEFAQRVHTAAAKAGMLILVCGLHNNVIRFLHPLTISEDVMAEGLDRFVAEIGRAHV